MKACYDRSEVEAAVRLGRHFTHLTPTEVFTLVGVCRRLSVKAERAARSAASKRFGRGATHEEWADVSTKLRREALRELESFRIPSVNVAIERETPAFTLIYE